MIGPGDSVVCIKEPKEHPLAPWVFPPRLKSEWVVTAVGPDLRNGSEAVGICLLGDGLPAATGDGRRPAWPISCFRKLASEEIGEEDAEHQPAIQSLVTS